MMKNTVELSFQYTRMEYTKAFWLHLLSPKRIRVASILICTAFVLLVAAIMIFPPFWRFGVGVLFVFLLHIPLLLIACYIAPGPSFKVMTIFSKGNKLVFSTDEISWKTPDGEMIFGGRYLEVQESNGFFFFILPPNIWLVIPKRALKDVFEEQTFEVIAASSGVPIKRI
ncbi:MAG: hypothetical protein FWC93_05485 [Defluviitaleaceae bacterium]|nr:hypothetical protein [Defluviitaleaceae bacterium]